MLVVIVVLFGVFERSMHLGNTFCAHTFGERHWPTINNANGSTYVIFDPDTVRNHETDHNASYHTLYMSTSCCVCVFSLRKLAHTRFPAQTHTHQPQQRERKRHKAYLFDQI